ncbi:hypothetical protein FGIG_02117 [Fasciola gigantica]|uniref:Uncharacterized protein n=1 Tax=Fasciola gigantica TaxID=46835 RepID=A0A504YLE9_FASGI|nr:hypothetical protein FGIG_02117 [Fasciola gigantica]
MGALMENFFIDLVLHQDLYCRTSFLFCSFISGEPYDGNSSKNHKHVTDVCQPIEATESLVSIQMSFGISLSTVPWISHRNAVRGRGGGGGGETRLEFSGSVAFPDTVVKVVQLDEVQRAHNRFVTGF